MIAAISEDPMSFKVHLTLYWCIKENTYNFEQKVQVQ